MRGLAAGEPVAGLLVRERPPPMPLVGVGRAPYQQYDGVDHVWARSGGDSVVVVLGRQLWSPDEATMAFVASST